MSEGYAMHMPAAQTYFSSVGLKQVIMHWDASVEIMTGWIRSWSPFLAYREAKGDMEAELQVEQYGEELMEALGLDSENEKFTVTLSLELLLATND